jgi:hypothetical protein
LITTEHATCWQVRWYCTIVLVTQNIEDDFYYKRHKFILHSLSKNELDAFFYRRVKNKRGKENLHHVCRDKLSQKFTT